MTDMPVMPVEFSDNVSDNIWKNGHVTGEKGRGTEENV